MTGRKTNFTLIRVGENLRYAENEQLFGFRAFLVCASVVFLGGSLVFLSQLDSAGKTGGMLATLAGFLSFGAFSAFCIWLGLFKPTHSYEFNAATRRIVHSTFAPARGRRRREYAFGDVLGTELVSHLAEDGETSYWIQITLNGPQRLELGVYQEHEGATAALSLIQRCMARPQTAAN